MSVQGTPVPAGWYPDPQNPAVGRYWDGSAWTDLVHQPGQPQPIPKAPPGTDGNTAWVWIIIAIQFVPLLLLVFVPWGAIYDVDLDDPTAGMTSSLALFGSPFYWGAILTSYLVYGLSVFFAYRDRAELLRRGVPKPFHWAFAFINAPVYTIGRAVVVHRRTGRGHAPLWAEIGYIVASFVVTGVIVAQLLSGLAGLFEQISRVG
jgi:hypothetical protein